MNVTPVPVAMLGRTFLVGGDDTDSYFRMVRKEGRFADPLLTTMAGLIREDDVCLDIGANIGLTTLAISALAPGGRVFAFEPNPRTFESLCGNAAANGAANVSCHNLALSDAPGQLRFMSVSGGLACSFALREGDAQAAQMFDGLITVPAVSVDAFVAQAGIERLDFVKIDVEGFELNVLAGCSETLRRLRPIVLLEFNSSTLIRFADVSPRSALTRIRSLFSETYEVGREDGSLAPIRTEREQDDFLCRNLHDGLVDDLVCTLPGEGARARIERAAALALQEAASREKEEARRAATMPRRAARLVRGILRPAARLARRCLPE